MKLSFLKKTLLFNVLLIVIILGILKGFITFGFGLGDLYYLGSLILILILNIYLLFTKKKGEQRSDVFKNSYIIFLFLLMFFLLLRLTYFRGSEYPWNGHLLYTN